MYEKMWQETVDEDLQECFNIFDSDGDGYITAQDLKELFSKMGELISIEEAIEILADCDLNSDGLIDYEGLRQFLFFSGS